MEEENKHAMPLWTPLYYAIFSLMVTGWIEKLFLEIYLILD